MKYVILASLIKANMRGIQRVNCIKFCSGDDYVHKRELKVIIIVKFFCRINIINNSY